MLKDLSNRTLLDFLLKYFRVTLSNCHLQVREKLVASVNISLANPEYCFVIRPMGSSS